METLSPSVVLTSDFPRVNSMVAIMAYETILQAQVPLEEHLLPSWRKRL